MSSFNIVLAVDSPVEIPRTKFLSEELVKARNYGMNQEYITKLQSVLLEMIPIVSSQDAAAAIAKYDSEYDTIVALRETAYEQMKQQCLAASIPPEKTPPE